MIRALVGFALNNRFLTPATISSTLQSVERSD